MNASTKTVIDFNNTGSVYVATPKNYSGTLGRTWFEEAIKGTDEVAIAQEAKERDKYQNQIIQEKIDIIKNNQLEFEKIVDNLMKFRRETDTNIYVYSFYFNKKDLPDIAERTGFSFPTKKGA